MPWGGMVSFCGAERATDWGCLVCVGLPRLLFFIDVRSYRTAKIVAYAQKIACQCLGIACWSERAVLRTLRATIRPHIHDRPSATHKI